MSNSADDIQKSTNDLENAYDEEFSSLVADFYDVISLYFGSFTDDEYREALDEALKIEKGDAN